jgi:hypothetical protein
MDHYGSLISAWITVCGSSQTPVHLSLDRPFESGLCPEYIHRQRFAHTMWVACCCNEVLALGIFLVLTASVSKKEVPIVLLRPDLRNIGIGL